MPLRRRLLHLLSDGEFHSGEALGADLGVSRMAVWKHLKALRALGLDITVHRGRGYRLPAGCELLGRDAILAASSAATRSALADVHVFLEIDSTNSWLRERALDGAPAGTVCVAELQTAGRGRRGREWVSPFAANLYLSLLWRSANGAASLGGLSLVTGIAVLRALARLGIQTAGLKWPNDIYADGGKLAGVLIDVVGEASGPCAAVIGIGVNVNMPPGEAARIEQAWTDLQRLGLGACVSRNLLAARLLDELLPAMAAFERDGLQPWLDDWRRHDLVCGRQVCVQLPGERVTGTARGIDPAGALLVDTHQGPRRFAAGDVSLRVAS